MASVNSGVISQTILDTVLADVNAVVPNFSSMVSSYRLLVGAAEEIRRLPGVSPDVLARAIERFDRTGVIIDILVDLLCCKISFSSDFLAVTGAPVDLFRLLANQRDVADPPHVVAEEILLLEVLRKAEQVFKGRDSSAEPPCTPPGPPPYTFATSFYQPPPPNPAPFPPHFPPEGCFTLRENPPPTPATHSSQNGEKPAEKKATKNSDQEAARMDSYEQTEPATVAPAPLEEFQQRPATAPPPVSQQQNQEAEPASTHQLAQHLAAPSAPALEQGSPPPQPDSGILGAELQTRPTKRPRRLK